MTSQQLSLDMSGMKQLTFDDMKPKNTEPVDFMGRPIKPKPTPAPEPPPLGSEPPVDEDEEIDTREWLMTFVHEDAHDAD